MVSKKVIVVAVVAVFLATALVIPVGHMLFDGRQTSNNNNNNNGGNNNGGDEHYSSITEVEYFDLAGAKSLSINTVEDSSASAASKVVASRTISTSSNGGAALMPTSNNISSVDGINYNGYHNELQKTDNNGKITKVDGYQHKSDMQFKKDELKLKENIIYLEKCGSMYLTVWWDRQLSELYNLLSQDQADFWNNGEHMKFMLIDAKTGKAFTLTGLWCGSSSWKYTATNDVLPSMQYMGNYEGKEYFKVNVECNKYCSMPFEGEFTNIEGVVAFDINGENLSYEYIMVDEDAMVKRYTGIDKPTKYVWSGLMEAKWELIDGKVKKYGYEMTLYDNGIIRYKLNDLEQIDEWQGRFTGEEYIRFPNGDSLKLTDGWEELSGYIYKSAEYENTYFPRAVERYESDGSTTVRVLTDAQSFTEASNKHYDGCIYREITDTVTKIYILKLDGSVDRLTLTNDLEFTMESDIFGGEKVILAEYKYRALPGDDYRTDFHVYNNQVYYEAIGWSYSMLSNNTKVSIIDDRLYFVDGTVMKEYTLSTAAIKEYEIPDDTAVSNLRVDEDQNVYIEGKSYDNICKLDLGDGGFQLSRTPPQMMTIKKILTDENEA